MNYIEKVEQLLSKEIDVNNNLLRLYALLALVKGKDVTLEDVHNAWSVDKNRTFPEHYSLIPFNELSFEVKQKDLPYVNAIKKVVKELERSDKK